MDDTIIQTLIADLPITEADIADLVQGIPRAQIIDLVKREKYLNQQVFRGFRPDHLPWQTVPAKFAQDAIGDFQKTGVLANCWLEGNQELVNKIAATPADKLLNEITSLLITDGLEKRTQILWALRLDKRPEVRELLTQSLAQELSDESSQLLFIIQTIQSMVNQAVEPLQNQLVERTAERDEARSTAVRLKGRLDTTTAQVETSQADYETAAAEKEHLQQRLSELESQKQTDQETIAQLQQQLDYAQTEVHELQQGIASLKDTLHQQAEAHEGRDDILLDLEEERKTSASLRLDVTRLDQQLSEAYEKRDEAVAQAEKLEAELSKTVHDKDVIINEKREVQAQLDAAMVELETARNQQEQLVIQQVVETAVSANLEAAWTDARQEIHQQLQVIVATLATDEPDVEVDKLNQWRKWADEEIDLVTETLQALTVYEETETVPDRKPVELAQSSLTVRWYLLEYVRRTLTRLEEQQMFPL